MPVSSTYFTQWFSIFYKPPNFSLKFIKIDVSSKQECLKSLMWILFLHQGIPSCLQRESHKGLKLENRVDQEAVNNVIRQERLLFHQFLVKLIQYRDIIAFLCKFSPIQIVYEYCAMQTLLNSFATHGIIFLSLSMFTKKNLLIWLLINFSECKNGFINSYITPQILEYVQTLLRYAHAIPFYTSC